MFDLQYLSQIFIKFNKLDWECFRILRQNKQIPKLSLEFNFDQDIMENKGKQETGERAGTVRQIFMHLNLHLMQN